LKILITTMRPFPSQDAAHGALPTLYAAVAAEAVAGGYYGPDGIAELKGYPPAALNTTSTPRPSLNKRRVDAKFGSSESSRYLQGAPTGCQPRAGTG
jgi:hypothetical protein